MFAFAKPANDSAHQWPITVDDDGHVISGRPDVELLVGFALPEQPLRIARYWEDAVDEPMLAQGMLAVFVATQRYLDKRMTFAVAEPVIAVAQHERQRSIHAD
jgi:hypothetical protein